MPDVIVIGGGVSGLSAAYHAARAGREVLVLERDEVAGGCIRSSRAASGYWHELGAHTCYNSYGGLLELLEARGALGKLLPRVKAPFRLLVGDEIRSVMAELNLFELLASAPKLMWLKKDGLSVKAHWRRVVGEQNYARVFGPLFAAVPSQPADDFPAEMLFKKRPRRKDVRKSYTLEGGLSTIIDVLASTPGVTVRTGVAVTKLSRSPEGFEVELAGERLTAKHVLLATPPDTTANLVRDVNAPAFEALRRIKVTPVKTVGAVVKASATPVKPFAGVIPLDGRFFSCVSRDTVTDATWRGFALHVRPSVSRSDALTQLAALLKVTVGDLTEVVEREVVLPSPVAGHAEVVAEIDRALVGTGLGITGNYFAGLSIEDCVQRSKLEVGRLLGGPQVG